MTRQLLESRLRGSIDAVTSLSDKMDSIATMCDAIRSALDAGHTLYTAGNGGSAAQAMHLTEELIGRYRGNRDPRAAVCLNTDPSALTCIANDFGYDAVFERQCRGLLKPGDVFLGLSTSGRSSNIIAALRAARELGAITVALLGKDGGDCVALADHVIIVERDDSAHIQEAHQVLIHLICEVFEQD